MTIPLLIFSDAPSAPSGLARIARDLATRIAVRMPDVFQVATVGYGGSGSSRLPFPQYSWTLNDDWIIHDLPEIWRDFAGDRKGIFLSIQDPSRMVWFARPEACSDERVRQFLAKPPFRKWGYFPIDAHGPNGKLSFVLKECLLGYDRILCYSKWAEDVVRNTIGDIASTQKDLSNLPHGIDTDVFNPRGKSWRQVFGELAVNKKVSVGMDETLIGIVATNQVRKDYGLAISVVAELAKRRKVRLWMHTDHLDRFWSIPYLMSDFGLLGEHICSLSLVGDENMAKLYSACDITLAPGRGEGFGYPIFESLACGTPVVHGNYGGAPEYLEKDNLVTPAAYQVEGNFNNTRPVYSVDSWLYKVEKLLNAKKQAELPQRLAWKNLWDEWEKWFRNGVPVMEPEKVEVTHA